jgi:hypothetical protein
MFPRGMQPQASGSDKSMISVRSGEFVLLVNDIAGLEASDTVQSML